ncbi:hypothetical protein [Myxosarcina sp. GI1]|nr:hypothetical protein [Myxosarcina sp. GI1]
MDEKINQNKNNKVVMPIVIRNKKIGILANLKVFVGTSIIKKS